jgi:hypothetical protein
MNILKNIVLKACKFSFYDVRFIGVFNRNTLPSNKSIRKLRTFGSKM